MVGPTERSDRIDIERRTVLKGVAGLGAAGLAGSASVGTAGAVANEGWGWGLDHTALGSADLAFEDDALVVSEVDDGESGVNVGLGEAQGVTVDTQFDYEVPVGSYRQFRSRGILDGEPDRELGLLHSERVDDFDGIALTPDFGPLGADAHTWELYDQGELVDRQEGITDPTIIPDREPNFEGKIIIIWTGGQPIIIVVITGVSGPVVGPRMEEYVGNEIRLLPEEVEITPDATTDLDVVGADREQFVVDGESVHALDNPHRQRGNARLHPSDFGETLTVSSVEASSADGVAIDTREAAAFDATLREFDLTETEATATFDVRGTVDETPDALLGSASLTNVGGEFEVAADFGELGAEGVLVEGFAEGEKVGESAVESGIIGLTGGVDLVGWCGSDGDPWPPDDGPWPPVIGVGFGDGEPMPLPVDLADGTTFEADELRVSPADPVAEVSAVSEFGIEAAGVEEFGIVNERRGSQL